MHDDAAQDHDGRLARSHARAGLHALVRAVDLREPRLTGHAERVGALADRLADRLGWSPARRALLREAAFLHDVGKVAIPAAVLGAGTALDADARSSTRAHPVLGADMSAEVLDREQASWIRHHHEWWDGGGYPDGLQGEEIPDGARLLGLAEAWDAMTRTGPGDRPRTRAEALAECRRQAGTQFAPDAVDALEALGASADLPGPADH
jgi:HD-GYP domain-containing protein (c-di-GMP phosphodiesterase class II)